MKPQSKHPTTALYECLVYIAKSLGAQVIHRRMSYDYGYQHYSKIVLDSRIKNRKIGISIVAHEIGHLCHMYEGKFKKFCELGKMKFTKSNWNLVRRAEIQASKDGRQLLRALKAPPVYFRELDPSQRKKLEKLWRKEYFSD